jgi:hypothetical protein
MNGRGATSANDMLLCWNRIHSSKIQLYVLCVMYIHIYSYF